MGKGDVNTREKTLEHTLKPEEKTSEYTPQPDDEIVEDNFDTKSKDDILIAYGIVSVLPAEYDCVSEVSETDEDYIQDEAENQKPLCYYLMTNGVVEGQQAIFEKPDVGMMYHLKPLFIREMVDNMAINKVFFDGGAIVNLMSHSLFKNMGKINANL